MQLPPDADAPSMTTPRDAPTMPARAEPPSARALADLAGLSPAYFGMVMATGNVSLAAYPLAADAGEVIAAVGVAWHEPTEQPPGSITAPVLALCTAALQRAWATDDLARLAALLDTLLQEAPVGFAFIDPDLRFSHVNRRLAETNRRSLTDHVGRSIHEVVPHLASQIEPVLRRVIDEGVPMTDIEIVGETPAAPGQTRVWEESFYPVRAAGIGIIGAGVVVVEVTEQRREQARLRRLVDREREIARRLQAGLLPTDIPAVEGFEITARYAAGTAGLTVGGDWYEVLEISDRDVALVVGDAVGHDLDAAIAMSQIRGALTGLSHTTDDPATVVERLDEWAAHNPSALASTLFYGRLDPQTGMLRYTLAGHHPPLVVHGDGGHDWFDADPGPPIGMVSTRVTNECPFRPGDTLICYTDGLIEDREEPIEAGRRRLVETAVELNSIASLSEFTDALLRRVPNPAGEDDIVLLNLRRNP